MANRWPWVSAVAALFVACTLEAPTSSSTDRAQALDAARCGGFDLTMTCPCRFHFDGSSCRSDADAPFCASGWEREGSDGPCVRWVSASSAAVADPWKGRRGHSAVALDATRALVVGGLVSGNATTTGAIYDAATQTWTELLPAEELKVARTLFTLDRVATGDVWAIGGSAAGNEPRPLASAERFDPASRTWTVEPNALSVGRFGHRVVSVLGGHLLMVAGGTIGRTPLFTTTTELLDADSSTWRLGPELAEARGEFAMAAWGSVIAPRVVVAGGIIESEGLPYGSVAVDILTATFTAGNVEWSSSAGPSLPEPRYYAAARTLDDGSVLVMGGDGAATGLRTAVRLPARGESWLDGTPHDGAGASLRHAWVGAEALALRDGRIALFGSDEVTSFAEVVTISDGASTSALSPDSGVARNRDATSTLLCDGRAVLVVGGEIDPKSPIAGPQLYLRAETVRRRSCAYYLPLVTAR